MVDFENFWENCRWHPNTKRCWENLAANKKPGISEVWRSLGKLPFFVGKKTWVGFMICFQDFFVLFLVSDVFSESVFFFECDAGLVGQKETAGPGNLRP